jgi:oxalate decarboxylase/phosphoglucose isomerase-like protein (cupin superfamily)
MHAWQEVVVCVHGELAMVIDGKSSTMAAGGSITVPPNAHHVYMNTGPTTCRFLAVDARADDPRVVLETWDQMERAGKTGRWRYSAPHTGSHSFTDEEPCEVDGSLGVWSAGAVARGHGPRATAPCLPSGRPSQ